MTTKPRPESRLAASLLAAQSGRVILRLWLLVVLALAGAFAPSRAGARVAETRTWDFFAANANVRPESAPQVADSRLGFEGHGYELAPGYSQAAENAAVKLTQSEASALSKIKNILNKGIKPGPKGDISGAVADMVGAPIPKPGGGVWDHAQDLGGMLRGLRNNAAKLSNSTDPAAVAARQQAQQMIQTIEAAIKGNGL